MRTRLGVYLLQGALTFAASTTVTAVTATAAAAAASKLTCENAFAKASFWDRTRASIAPDQPLTFSYDSESLIGAVWSYIAKSSSDVEKARKQLLEIYPPLPRAEVIKDLGLSPQQFAMFGVRKGVDPNQATFSIADLNSKAGSWIASSYPWDQAKQNRQTRFLRQQLTPLLAAAGLAVDASSDYKSPEIRHASYELSPQDYRAAVKQLTKIFPEAATHMHVGLPADSLSPEQAVEIARPLEARIILGLLIHADKNAPHLRFLHSTFSSKLGDIDKNRGFVKLEFNFFKAPVLAHDLEIRQAFSLEDELQSVEIASHLAAKGGRRLATLDPALGRSDPRFGHVAYALDFAAQVIGPMQPELAARLHALAAHASLNENSFSGHQLKDKMLEDISRTLRETGAYAVFTEALLKS